MNIKRFKVTDGKMLTILRCQWVCQQTIFHELSRKDSWLFLKWWFWYNNVDYLLKLIQFDRIIIKIFSLHFVRISRRQYFWELLEYFTEMVTLKMLTYIVKAKTSSLLPFNATTTNWSSSSHRQILRETKRTYGTANIAKCKRNCGLKMLENVTY